ncbi:hypothetical protein LGH83_17720 [Lichenihabitans sp. PAMC28606]|uniref:hypothetical protein n=1 Tax=Lichenihabitans TaxID=2723776 RepID=UPI0010384C93|nr:MULTISPECIES: hypothetical protein [Lichenihabitans]UDL94330.1 hypothetical protein LGH83_17720 [Lichenihabitans sp. PAMC28606]
MIAFLTSTPFLVVAAGYGVVTVGMLSLGTIAARADRVTERLLQAARTRDTAEPSKGLDEARRRPAA